MQHDITSELSRMTVLFHDSKFHLIFQVRRGILRLCKMCIRDRIGAELEEKYYVAPPLRKKKVLVVGGGPAGMEAAITAARRGHEVLLYEKTDALGGCLLYTSRCV